MNYLRILKQLETELDILRTCANRLLCEEVDARGLVDSIRHLEDEVRNLKASERFKKEMTELYGEHK